MTPTTAQIKELLERLPKEAAALAADLAHTPRSPYEYRFAEQRLNALEAKYAACWVANQKTRNLDGQLADPEVVVPGLREVQIEIEIKTERAIDKLERTPQWDEAKRRAVQAEIQALAAERDVILRGPEAISSYVAVPDRLVQRLAARGITPLPGCSHVFERRGGLLTLEPVLKDLRQQRAAAMAVLVRELELKPVAG